MAKIARLARDQRDRAGRAQFRAVGCADTRYWAFLSYSHADEESPTGCTSIEEFHIPKGLAGRVTAKARCRSG